MAKLDRSRSYGTVCGVAGHAFEQDGKSFDSEGVEVKTIAATTAPAKPEDSNAATNAVSFDSAAIAAMDLAQLHQLAKDKGLTLHPRTGADKLRAALLALLPAETPQDTELAAQMNA